MTKPEAAENHGRWDEKVATGLKSVEVTWMGRFVFVECGGENTTGVIRRGY